MTPPGCVSYIGVAPLRYRGNPDARAFPGALGYLSRGGLTWPLCLYFSHLLSFKVSGSNPVLPQVFLGTPGAPHPPCRKSAEVGVCKPHVGPRSSSQCARQWPCGETGRRGVAPAAEPAPSPAWWPHTFLPVAHRSLPLRADVTPGPPRFSWPTPSVHAVLGPRCLCGLVRLRGRGTAGSVGGRWED